MCQNNMSYDYVSGNKAQNEFPLFCCQSVARQVDGTICVLAREEKSFSILDIYMYGRKPQANP